ncbi:DUF86 domain-containing protein [Acidimicrobiaceae bacterium USS-CC1]|uniref:DUF86 domain-containing protein n=1 Tax=Acidiferrimicrobium australe TaxID=2664430 RepID=A0ABW9QNT8_9ACTN|nr:DUF86 domain-containing protein [Acidiferrimicrobium australe]
MTRHDDERVCDILDATQQVATIVAGGETAFRADRVRQLAVERLLEIIGESARAMSEAGRGRYPGAPWADIVGLRTLLAHHYHRVDPNQVWVIATVSVPELARLLSAR